MGAPLHFLFSLMLSEGLSGPGGEMLRAGQTVGSNLSAPLTLPPQKESTNNIYLCYSGRSKAPSHGRTTAFWPSAGSPRRVRKRLPGPDGRVNLSGAQGGNPFNGQGGAAAENALISFDPAFLGGR